MDGKATNELFELPEYVRVVAIFTYNSINELVRRKDPILSQIPVNKVDEIPTAQYSLPSGETLEIEPIYVSGTANLQTDDLLSGELNSYYIFLNEVAENMLPQMKQQFYEHVNSVCDAFGQSVSAEGQPISHELIMKLLERKQIEFDDNGNFAEGETLVLNSSTVEQLRNLPPMTAEQEKAWNDLMERKRQEFYARKRTRKLSR